MVVGGAAGFVGSRRGEAQQTIAAALAAEAGEARITAEARVRGRAIEVAYQTAGLVPGQVVQVALVQREAASSVARGENRGRQLRHVQVVRAFETRRDAAGTVRLDLPRGLDAANARVVAFVQQGETGPVAAVATADVAGAAL